MTSSAIIEKKESFFTTSALEHYLTYYLHRCQLNRSETFSKYKYHFFGACSMKFLRTSSVCALNFTGNIKLSRFAESVAVASSERLSTIDYTHSTMDLNADSFDDANSFNC